MATNFKINRTGDSLLNASPNSQLTSVIDAHGGVQYGLHDKPVSRINYEDYPLKTPMGIKVPKILKNLKVNQFIFFGIAGPELMLGLGLVDLKFAANAFLYVYDRKNRNISEKAKLTFSSNISIPKYPDSLSSIFESEDLFIKTENGSLFAETEGISLDAELNLRDISPLRLCTRAGYRGWVYTQKSMPLRLSGKIVHGDRTVRMSSPSYMALADWTAGYMRRNTFWNWASTACTLPDGRSFGLNLSCGVNETGFTENAFWISGKMTKVDMVNFAFREGSLLETWHITSFDRKIDLIFHPEYHRRENINILVAASKFTQLMGIFEGRVTTDAGESIHIAGCPGWVEDHYAKW